MTVDERRILKNKGQQERYRKDPEKIKERSREYRKNHLDESRERVREWTKKNPEKKRNSDQRWKKNNPEKRIAYSRITLLKRHGLTTNEYDKMLSDHNGVCAICGGTNQNGRRLSVDHNHATGENRGLLCNPCNVALGLFRDNKEFLSAAISYLMNYEN